MKPTVTPLPLPPVWLGFAAGRFTKEPLYLPGMFCVLDHTSLCHWPVLHSGLTCCTRCLAGWVSPELPPLLQADVEDLQSQLDDCGGTTDTTSDTSDSTSDTTAETSSAD